MTNAEPAQATLAAAYANPAQATLAAALVAAQADMPAVEKDSTNPHFKSRFTSLDHLIAKTRPVLNRHGLAITQWPSFLQGDNGSVQHTLQTRLTHVDGESMVNVMVLIVAKNDMQGLGSALTYAKRYAWAAALGISTDEDDDGNVASRPEAPPPEPEAPKAKPSTVAARKRMHALFHEAGIDDRAGKLTFTVGIINRGVTTSTDMTADEVKQVSKALESAPKPGGAGSAGPEPPDAPGPAESHNPPSESYTEMRKTSAATPPQLERLDELLAQAMEDRTGAIPDLWAQVAAYRKRPLAELMVELEARPGQPLLWAPLRAALTRLEAGDLADHLVALRRELGLPEDDIPF